jgi:hypothetical protein
MVTKQVGDISEITFAAWCLEQGAGFSLPLGDRLPYDVIVDYDSKLIKAQVKTMWQRRDGVLAVSIKSVSTRNGKYISTGYDGKVDVIVGFDPTTRKLYRFLPEHFNNKYEISLRSKAAKNNQHKKTNKLEDFELTSLTQLC